MQFFVVNLHLRAVDSNAALGPSNAGRFTHKYGDAMNWKSNASIVCVLLMMMSSPSLLEKSRYSS